MRVLVVSDDRRVLEEARYGFPDDAEVVAAGDAREASDLLSERPDVAILDIQSGNAGGYALARDMSQIDGIDDVPILMLLEREQDSWLATQAGAARYRTKPIETEELVFEALALIPH